MGRMFEDAQLQEIAEPPCDKALRALAAGDLAALDGLLQQMADGPAALHALGMPIVTGFFSEFREDFGEERAKEMLERIGRNMLSTMIEDYRAGREKQVIADLLSILKHQYGSGMASLQETAEEIVCDLAPCGSGGKAPADGRAPWSDGLNSYCQYCKATQRAFNEAVGREAWSTEIGAELTGRCTVRFRKTRAGGLAYFAGPELQAMSRSKVELAREKLAAGDPDVAALLEDQHREWLPWHDFMCATIGYVFGSSYAERGAQYLDDKLASAYGAAFSAFYPYYHAMDDEQNLRGLCLMHNYHFMTFSLTEEDDRFAFRLDPCGSGGRLYRGQFWRDLFRYGGEISPLMKEEHVVNFHRRDFPVYCAHCSAHNRDQFRRGNLWFINDGHLQMQPGMPCVQYYYKKSKGITTAQVDPKLRAQVDM